MDDNGSVNIKSVFISNFRGIDQLDAPVEFGSMSFFIGDNGTGKTSLLEAVNFCLSSGYVASRLDLNDFHNGNDEPIEIVVTFQNPIVVTIPDGFTSQKVLCDKVRLFAKKRDRAAAGKSFSDLVTTSHHFVPVDERGENGWALTRKGGTVFQFDERQLALNNVEADLPRVFYFSKTRARQLSKGYNSSLSSIIQDLNWRFDRSQRKKTEVDHFKHDRKALHQRVFADTEGDTLKNTIEAANKILVKLGVHPVEVSLFKTLNPYDQSEVIFPFDGFELPVEHAGSGIEMVLSLVLLESMAKLSRDKLVILIDEPELHLHPKLQSKLVDHLTDLSGSIQIIASTHSPLLFKNIFQIPQTRLQITKKTEGKVVIADAHAVGFGYLSWSPSWGEICYLAYDLPTTDFHDDLYSSLEDAFRSSPSVKTSQVDFDNWLESRGHAKEVRWVDAKGISREETLMTFIRNKNHHPDNRHRPEFTDDQLTESIAQMCKLIRPTSNRLS